MRSLFLWTKPQTQAQEVTVIILKQPKRISQTGIIAELSQNLISVSGIRKLTRDEIYQF